MTQREDEQKPTANLQWKGTNACIDIHCSCGTHFHFDGYFMYSWECGECGRSWDMSPSITMTPMKDGDAACFTLTTGDAQ